MKFVFFLKVMVLMSGNIHSMNSGIHFHIETELIGNIAHLLILYAVFQAYKNWFFEKDIIAMTNSGFVMNVYECDSFYVVSGNKQVMFKITEAVLVQTLSPDCC